jgi:NAD(P)H-dependent FMN reductase
MPLVLIVWHSATGGAQALAEALGEGASDDSIGGIEVVSRRALEAGVEDVLAADGLLLCTPENFGYMSGARKDFFDRTYYPCLEHTKGRPYGLLVKAGGGGTAAVDAVVPLATGLEWRPVVPPLVVAGDVTDEDLAAATELGATLAGGMATGLW